MKAQPVPPGVINVYPGDLSHVNVSADRTVWDSVENNVFSAFPAPGTKWVLDIEDKPQGGSEIDAQGLTLSVSETPAPTKVRYQYYTGSGGYPAIDLQDRTLATLFSVPLSWNQTLGDGGYPLFGVGLQIQLQKKIADTYARVTITNTALPGNGLRDLRLANWFANTDIHRDGYLSGPVVSVKWLTSGVSVSTLLKNFGDFDVVSFGPNLGRDNTYDYRIQDFTILGQTFHFTDVIPEPEPETGNPGEGTPTTPPVEPPVLIPEAPEVSPAITIVEPPITVSPRPQLVIAPALPEAPTLLTPPPVQTTQARVMAELGSTTQELLDRFSAANGGAVPPTAASVLTIAGSSAPNSNGSFDLNTPFSASVEWNPENGDQWVDVWARSSPTFIGTFPVINGVLQMRNADLSALEGGNHHLVFVGQTSGANQVVSLTMADTTDVPSSAATSATEASSQTELQSRGTDREWILWSILAVVIIGGAVTIGIRVRRTATQKPTTE